MSSWANLQNDGWTKLSFWVKIVDIFWICSALQNSYRISSYSFRGNYSFLNLEIQRSWYIKPNFTAHKCAATIQWRKLFKGGNYMRKYGILFSAWYKKNYVIHEPTEVNKITCRPPTYSNHYCFLFSLEDYNTKKIFR